MLTTKFYSKTKCFKFAAALIALIFSFSASGVILYAEDDVDTNVKDEVRMIMGELQTITVHSLTRISIADPSIVDIEDATADKVVLTATSVGETALFIWDKYGKRLVTVYVTDNDLSMLQKRLEGLFEVMGIKTLQISKKEKEGKIVVSGKVPEKKYDAFIEIIAPYENDVIDLTVRENPKDMVQLDLQITELSSTLSKIMGIDWGSGDAGLVLGYDEADQTFDGSLGDLFKIGSFSRQNKLTATVNALISEGKARVLSKPKVVVSSGEEATFLVGGEIPIRTTTSTGDNVQENVTFKDYGISMSVTPVLEDNDMIDLQLDVEVSDIDAANSSGTDVAFVTRSASTKLFLEDNQTIVLAGLIKHNDSDTVSRVPVISHIPVLGLLFRSRNTPETDTELVISITPKLLSKEKEKIEKIAKARIEKEALKEVKKTQEIQEKADVSQEPEDIDIDAILSEVLEEELIDAPKRIETEKIASKKDQLEEQKKADDKQKQEEAKKTEEELSSSMNKYVKAIQSKISNNIQYPREAQEYGWEGTAKVELLILKDGTLAFALVKETSGYEIFDDNALEVTKKSAPFGKFPANSDLQEIDITIPIVYKLRKN